MPFARVDELLESAVADGRAPALAAEISASTGCLYRGAAGLLSAEPDRPMPADAVFRIASLTKLVTSVALMMLVEDGSLELDAPLARYVPGFRQPGVLESFDESTGAYTTRPARRDATIRELMSHTGGYGYWFLDRPLLLASGRPPELVNPPFLMHDPGARFAYSTSADVVGQVVEPLSGQSLDAFFAARIFAPLEMADTGFALPRSRERLVPVRARRPDGLVTVPNETQGQPVRGGGGLYSTVSDYSRVLRLLLRRGELDGRRLLRPESAAEIVSNQIGALYADPPTTALPAHSNDFAFMDGTQKFGFGVMVETLDRPDGRSAGSFGWGGIVNTYAWGDPQADIAAVLFMQVSPFADPGCLDVLRQFESAVYGELGG